MIKITDFPDYSVTVDGRVWSHLSGRYLKSGPNSRGYVQVELRKDGKPHCQTMHRLVAAAFIPNPHNLPCVCHRDDDPTNNSVSNLFWGTQRDNMADKVAKGREARGESHGSVKLTAAQVAYIRGQTPYPGMYRVLSQELGVTKENVCHVVKRKSWKHLP